ncbi:MAG: zf-TFIIB domain-containing protein [Candidatus Eremiobacteraeota bacterium]|nr:zf-TFIIB domain-containing protein [Candidatus Eremiobacteraeota bacterium]
MKCPRCAQDMYTGSIQNAELDICPACDGIWFDQDELTIVIKMGEEEIEKSEIAPILQSGVIKQESPGEGELLCPRCNEVMMRYYYAGVPGIVVNGCQKGCGIFTDDSELKKILEHVAEMSRPMSPEEQDKVNTILAKVNENFKKKEKTLIDSLVLMDKKPGWQKYPGSVLQFIYRMLYKAGL